MTLNYKKRIKIGTTKRVFFLSFLSFYYRTIHIVHSVIVTVCYLPVCLSVCLSVTLRYHNGLIRLVYFESNYTSSLFEAANIGDLIQRNIPNFYEHCRYVRPINTPCRNRGHSIIGITLTNLNTVSQFWHESS